jgi:hypothetical protein
LYGLEKTGAPASALSEITGRIEIRGSAMLARTNGTVLFMQEPPGKQDGNGIWMEGSV